MSPTSIRRTLRALQDFLDHAGAEGAQSVVFRVMDALGTWQWFELQSQPLQNPADPESVQLIGVLADITERERLAEHATLQRKFLEVLAQSPDRPTLIATMLDTVLGLWIWMVVACTGNAVMAALTC